MSVCNLIYKEKMEERKVTSNSLNRLKIKTKNLFKKLDGELDAMEIGGEKNE